MGRWGILIDYLNKMAKTKRKVNIERFNKRELAIGSRIEMEHTKSKRVATRIAKDHLREYPKYYSKGLIPMERKLKKLQGGK